MEKPAIIKMLTKISTGVKSFAELTLFVFIIYLSLIKCKIEFCINAKVSALTQADQITPL
jgi:hypothetical protein